MPRFELRRQLVAVLIVRKGTQVRTFFRPKDKNTHGSVFTDAVDWLGLAVGVNWLLACVRNKPLTLRLLAHELARATDRVGLFPVFALRRLFIGAPSFHFTKDALTLHFLLQNTKGLLNIVVAHKNLQLAFLVWEVTRRRYVLCSYPALICHTGSHFCRNVRSV